MQALGNHTWRLLIENLIWPILVVTAIGFSIFAPNFLSVNNISNIFVNASVLGFLVIGGSLVLLTRNFDLSTESTLGFTAMLGAWLVTSSSIDVSPGVALPLMLVVGGVIGYINGTLVTRLKMNAFIVTLAALIILRGFTYVINDAATIGGLPDPFTFLGSENLIGRVSLAAVLLVLAVVVTQAVLNFTPFGRRLLATGGNPDAARASGIDPGKVMRRAFVINGVLAAFAGIILAGQLQSVSADAGQGLIFQVFAAAVIGGVSLQGGRGTIIGAFGGVLFLAVVDSGLNLVDVNPFLVEPIRGFIILFAVFVDSRKASIRAKRQSRDRAEDSRGSEAPAGPPEPVRGSVGGDPP